MRQTLLVVALVSCAVCAALQAQNTPKPPFTAADATRGLKLAELSLEVRKQIGTFAAPAEPFKIMSKMGISTLQSYRGAQIFEAIGLDAKFVETYFTKTPSRIGGIGLEEIAAETMARHQYAFPERPVRTPDLDWGGQYQWRQDGEYHMPC